MVQFYYDWGDPEVERLARAAVVARGADPDEMIPDSGYSNAPLGPRWWHFQDAAHDFLAMWRAMG